MRRERNACSKSALPRIPRTNPPVLTSSSSLLSRALDRRTSLSTVSPVSLRGSGGKGTASSAHVTSSTRPFFPPCAVRLLETSELPDASTSLRLSFTNSLASNSRPRARRRIFTPPSAVSATSPSASLCSCLPLPPFPASPTQHVTTSHRRQSCSRAFPLYAAPHFAADVPLPSPGHGSCARNRESHRSTPGTRWLRRRSQRHLQQRGHPPRRRQRD